MPGELRLALREVCNSSNVHEVRSQFADLV